MPTIDDVRAFWDENPLWTGEATDVPGSPEFFDSHTRACLEMTGGRINPLMLPVCDKKDGLILDLGCGIGFWPEQFGKRGFLNITAADLSQRSLDLTRRRCEINGISAKFSLQNAEAMTFPDSSFDYVSCHGVIHHSPNPAASVAEIYRVLKPGGRAVISVYYLNAALRMWPLLRHIAAALPALKGRGRETMMQAPTVNDLVRLYDGSKNPIGYAYSKKTYLQLLRPLVPLEIFYCSFPSRALPIRLSAAACRAAERALPFLIGAVIVKP